MRILATLFVLAAFLFMPAHVDGQDDENIAQIQQKVPFACDIGEIRKAVRAGRVPNYVGCKYVPRLPWLSQDGIQFRMEWVPHAIIPAGEVFSQTIPPGANAALFEDREPVIQFSAGPLITADDQYVLEGETLKFQIKADFKPIGEAGFRPLFWYRDETAKAALDYVRPDKPIIQETFDQQMTLEVLSKARPENQGARSFELVLFLQPIENLDDGQGLQSSEPLISTYTLGRGNIVDAPIPKLSNATGTGGDTIYFEATLDRNATTAAIPLEFEASIDVQSGSVQNVRLENTVVQFEPYQNKAFIAVKTTASSNDTQFLLNLQGNDNNIVGAEGFVKGTPSIPIREPPDEFPWLISTGIGILGGLLGFGLARLITASSNSGIQEASDVSVNLPTVSWDTKKVQRLQWIKKNCLWLARSSLSAVSSDPALQYQSIH